MPCWTGFSPVKIPHYPADDALLSGRVRITDGRLAPPPVCSRVITGCRGPLGLKVELAFSRAWRAAATGVLSAAAPWKGFGDSRSLSRCKGGRTLSDRGHEDRELKDLAANRSVTDICCLISNLFFFQRSPHAGFQWPPGATNGLPPLPRLCQRFSNAWPAATGKHFKALCNTRPQRATEHGCLSLLHALYDGGRVRRRGQSRSRAR